MFIVAIPCFQRNMDSLKYTSTIALFSALYLLLIVIIYAFAWPLGMPESGKIPYNEIKWVIWDFKKILSFTPLFVFSFTCHQNVK